MPTTAPHTESTPAPGSIAAWRVLLRMLSAFMALFCYAFWAAAGSNLGWTKTQIPIEKTDDVTGIHYTVYQAHFMPGLDLFVPALLFCATLFGLTYIRRSTR